MIHLRKFHRFAMGLLAVALLGLTFGCGSSNELGSTCSSADDCEDNNPCTTGICTIDGACEQIANVGVSCDDFDVCTSGELCTAEGTCSGGTHVEMPQDPCQICVCDPEQGISCEVMKPGDPCSDNDCCTSNDQCLGCDPELDEGCSEQGLHCTGTATDCDDEKVCTVDVCNCDESDNPVCENVVEPDGTPCSFNENDCTTGDSCIAGECQPGDPADLNDNNPCTQDYCEKGEIKHDPLTEGQCDDGDNCTTDDHCYLGTCIGGGQVECAVPYCASGASCVSGEGCVVQWMPEGAQCEGGDACSSVSICDADHNCVGGGSIVCDDENPCTSDTCDAEEGCLFTNTTEACDDGDPCTTDDICSEGTCGGTALPVNGIEFDCNQVNDIDNGVCCCYQSDPTGTYLSAHIIDMGQGFLEDGEVYDNADVEFCIKTGWNAGCTDVANMDVSADGVNWTHITSFPTESVPKPGGGWEEVCQLVFVPVPFRYVRGGNSVCYVDKVRVAMGCEATSEGCAGPQGSCDDGNGCTLDSCDEVTGECVYEPSNADNCLHLNEGNNLVSFRYLPEQATIASVFGEWADEIRFIMGEGTIHYRFPNGEYQGNIHTLERTAGYWVNMDLPTGQSSVTIELPGTATDPDVKYQLHAGVNSLSFASDSTDLAEALSSQPAGFFETVVGEGIAAFWNGTQFIGSLTALKPNRGYEIKGASAVTDFQYSCAACDGATTYQYGCTDPAATNTNPAAHIDDGSCAYNLPAGWGQTVWAHNKNQSFYFFHQWEWNGDDIEAGDAIAVFINGQMSGVGFPVGDYTVVVAVNSDALEGDPVTFEFFDVGTGQISPISTDEVISWSLNDKKVLGCDDIGASNYHGLADDSELFVGTDTCD